MKPRIVIGIALAVAACLFGRPTFAQLAYVTNGNGNTVSVIDIGAGTVIGTITVGTSQ